jgi:hypothetical protein
MADAAVFKNFQAFWTVSIGEKNITTRVYLIM